MRLMHGRDDERRLCMLSKRTSLNYRSIFVLLHCKLHRPSLQQEVERQYHSDVMMVPEHILQMGGARQSLVHGLKLKRPMIT